MTTPYISSRQRVQMALNHQEPDRVPVDFMATPAVWAKLTEHFEVETITLSRPDYFQPEREAVLRELQIDCRVLSYDMFCQPPEALLKPEATVDWWGARQRSTPARMWRQRTLKGEWYDIWGHHSRLVRAAGGPYEEFASWPLADAETVTDLHNFPWPQPEWWDFSGLPDLVRQLERGGEYHLRFRIGSVFETAWQLRGMQQLLMDFALDPAIPLYIMDRVTEVLEENLRRVLELVGGRLDMVYFYDDVATLILFWYSHTAWVNRVQCRRF
ncbi:MAG TPA: hypothetical protein VHO69_18095 [Phototrophicaceae bacterium]|nr:hypothetical protein [Phototrophicaceae bacterium]